jgi:uncharacterized cupin superfamily protein
VIDLLSILVLATSTPTPPVRLVLDPALLVRLQTLAAGLQSEIVLCLTGTAHGDTVVATGFTMPDPQLSAADHATFGPCPQEAVAIWHNHPLETRVSMTPRELCSLSETDIHTAAQIGQPFVVIAVDASTWCWWSHDQVRSLAARNAPRGDPVPGQISSLQTTILGTGTRIY